MVRDNYRGISLISCVYKLFSATYKNRKMFSFMGFGELSIMPKVDKPISQVSNVYQFPIKQYYNQKRRVK